jgi:hypothetical protein
VHCVLYAVLTSGNLRKRKSVLPRPAGASWYFSIAFIPYGNLPAIQLIDGNSPCIGSPYHEVPAGNS